MPLKSSGEAWTGFARNPQQLEALLTRMRWSRRCGDFEAASVHALNLNGDRHLWLATIQAMLEDAIGVQPGQWCDGEALVLLQADALTTAFWPGCRADLETVCHQAEVDAGSLLDRMQAACRTAGVLDDHLMQLMLRDHDPLHIVAADLWVRQESGQLHCHEKLITARRKLRLSEPWPGIIAIAADLRGIPQVRPVHPSPTGFRAAARTKTCHQELASL